MKDFRIYFKEQFKKKKKVINTVLPASHQKEASLSFMATLSTTHLWWDICKTKLSMNDGPMLHVDE